MLTRHGIAGPAARRLERAWRGKHAWVFFRVFASPCLSIRPARKRGAVLSKQCSTLRALRFLFFPLRDQGALLCLTSESARI